MEKMFLRFLNSKWVQCCLIFLAIIIVLIPIVGSLFKAGISCDSAYYICIAQRISEGYVPYKSISCGYTPLYLYIMAGFKMIFNVPDGCYWPYLLLHYVFEFGTSYFVYAIAREFGAKKMIAFLGAWLNILMLHWLDGNTVLLEVPSLFFGLASSLFVLRYAKSNIWNFVWIGCLTMCAFLCKQFGLGFVALNLYLMIVVNRQSWKMCGIFILGCAIPVVLCFMYWGECFFPVVFSDYGSENVTVGSGTFVNKINGVVSSLFYFCYMVCVAVIVGLLSLYEAFKSGHLWKLLYGYAGVIGFSLQFLFAGPFHYMMFMVPFSCLVLTEMLSIKDIKVIEIFKVAAVFWVILVNLYKVYNNRVYKQYIKNDIRKEQYRISNEIFEYVKKGETVWVVHTDLYHFLFTANVLPPNISTIGYSFGPLGLNESSAFQQANNADWIIRLSNDDGFDSYFTDSLRRFVEQCPLVAQYEDSTILLHKVPKQ